MGKNNLIKKTTVETVLTDGTYIPAEYDETPPGFVKPLSKTEQKRRAELEGIISRNIGAYVAVGCALREIQKKRLYRITHKTFSLYCKELWEFTRQRALQYIDAANVVDNLKQLENDNSCCQNIFPKNESQARILARFELEKQREIWIEAVKTAPKGKISAAHIKKTARTLHFEQVRKTIQKAKNETNEAPKINEDFRRTFSDFLDAINIERASEYRDTDRKEVIRHVRIILDALEAEL